MASTPKFTDMKHAYLRFLVSHKILPFVLFHAPASDHQPAEVSGNISNARTGQVPDE